IARLRASGRLGRGLAGRLGVAGMSGLVGHSGKPSILSRRAGARPVFAPGVGVGRKPMLGKGSNTLGDLAGKRIVVVEAGIAHGKDLPTRFEIKPRMPAE